MSKYAIDLVSDTATRPGPAMREAMASAEVGDEQLGEDPTVNELCARVAQLLGHDEALFLPSGTMCNAIAILVHCNPGDEIIAADSAHIVSSEGAGPAVLAGSFVHGIPSPDAIFSAADVHARIRPKKPKAPRSRLVELEQTTNRGGGAVWPIDTVTQVSEAAREHGLSVHMDGARLMNAVVASGVPADRYGGAMDSVWLDLSKGLGCPVGGVLAGSRAFMDEAWIWKHRLGGAMRQAGTVAAAGIYALEHNIERLADDHDNARILAERIAQIPGLAVVNPRVETNLLFFDVSETGLEASDVAAQLGVHGIRIGIESKYRMRAVTHLDVDSEGVSAAASALADIVAAAPGQ
jgi:threonine aldolase